MNNVITENCAVFGLSHFLSETELIDTHLTKGEKDMSFDGYIDVYKESAIFSKKSRACNLRAQIKGKSVTTLPSSKKKYNYSIEIADLAIYLKDGGVLFFLVLISPKHKEKYYYKYLFPISIRDQLKSTKNSKSITVKLEELDKTNLQHFPKLCEKYAEDARNQAPVSNIPIEKSLEIEAPQEAKLHLHAFQNNKAYALVIDRSINPVNSKSLPLPKDFSELNSVQEWYVYAELSPNYLVPIQGTSRLVFQSYHLSNLEISDIHGNSFSKKQKVIKNNTSETIIEIFPCLIFKVSIYKDKSILKFNLPPGGRLSERISSYKLLNALIEGELIINDKQFPKPFTKKNKHYKQIKTLFGRVSQFKKLFQKIPVLESLLGETLDEKVENSLLRLSNNLLEEDNQINISEYKLELGIIQIYRYNIGLVGIKNTNTNNISFINPYKFPLDDILKPSLINKTTDEIIPATIFFMLDSDFWSSSDNLSPNFVLRRIKESFLSNEKLSDRINLMALEILAAFDKTNKQQLLSLAYEIFNLLCLALYSW